MAVITRADSGLGPHRAGVMATPVPDLFGHHSVTPFWTGAQAARNLQQIARARGFLDVSYSWLGDRAGNEIEGRGWGRAGAHTQGFNTRSHALCFVGNLESTPMPDGMVRAAVRICRRASRYGPGRITRPHSAVSSTACPGRHARAQIPAINTAATGTPSGGDPMADLVLTPQEQRTMFDRIAKIGEALGLWEGQRAKYLGADIREILRQVTDDTPDSRTLHDRATRALRHARAAEARLDLLTAGAGTGLDPEAFAAAVVDALPPELAQQVVARIGVKLSESEAGGER